MNRRILVGVLAGTLAVPVAAQTPDFRWDGAIAANKQVSISNISGDIRVTASTTGRVEVVGFKRGDASDFDLVKVSARETASGIEICVIYYNPEGECGDRNWDRDDRRRRSVDAHINLEVAVPATARVKASNVSGDIFVTGAHGDISVNTVSGDLRIERLHADAVHAASVSGDIDVQLEELVGDGEMKFNSVSGDVTIFAPRTFGADISMSTVSGNINSDFPLLLAGGQMRRRNVEARIGAGGRRLDVTTVSGSLKIASSR